MESFVKNHDLYRGTCLEENVSPYDPAEGLYLGAYGGPGGGAVSYERVTPVLAIAIHSNLDFPQMSGGEEHQSLPNGALFTDWYCIAEQPAPAPLLAHPAECAAICSALRTVLVTVPRGSRSCEHVPDLLHKSQRVEKWARPSFPPRPLCKNHHTLYEGGIVPEFVYTPSIAFKLPEASYAPAKLGFRPCCTALTPNTANLIPTLGALLPRGGPVQDPVLTVKRLLEIKDTHRP